jgi:5,10-methylenetetrahydromethanopterin reductase
MVSTAEPSGDPLGGGDLGVAFDGRARLADLAEQARAADASGARTLWVASHLFLRDPITMANIALGATPRARIALMAMSPFSVHPVFIAMAAAALDEIHPGRVMLCLGAGAPGDLAAAGIETVKPLATLRESLQICRALLAGETIRHDGEVYRVTGRRLPNPSTRVPIVLAASGPQMLELAGAEANGVLISAATCVPFVRATFETVAEGEARRTIGGRCERYVIVYTRVGATEHAAIESIRRNMGFVLRGPHHAKNVAMAGSGLDQKALWDAYAAEDWATVSRLVTDDVVRMHAAAGTGDQVRARFAEYRALGADEVIIGGVDSTADIGRALAAVATQRGTPA